MSALANLTCALLDDAHGLCRQHEPAAPVSGIADQEMRLRMLTLGAILDVFPISERWGLIAGLADHWLLNVSDVAHRHVNEVKVAFPSTGLKGPRHNAREWWQVCRGVMSRAGGSIHDLLRVGEEDSSVIQYYLRDNKAMFPILSGPIISARWLDLVHRVGGVLLKNWDNLEVALSTRQQDAAAEFGETRHRAHPSVALSLDVWSIACQMLDTQQCGLDQCPRRLTDLGVT